MINATMEYGEKVDIWLCRSCVYARDRIDFGRPQRQRCVAGHFLAKMVWSTERGEARL